MTGDPRITQYDWRGGREAMLRFGPEDGPTVIAALPLFEEANRLRAFVVAVLRGLAARGIGGALPDLPGTGESMVPTDAASLADWREAFAAAAASLGDRTASITFRDGALLDGQARLENRWRFAPVDGAGPVRDLRRSTLAAAAARGDRITLAPLDRDGAPISLAGNQVAQALLVDLEAATWEAGRVVRLDSDPAPADRKLAGTPLWRRVEPGNDPALAAALIDDIAAWIATCGG